MAAMRPLTPLEEAQILAALKQPRDRLLFSFGGTTGFRVGELVSACVGQVWRAGRGVLDEITICRRCLKGGKSAFRRGVTSRSVPLHPQLKAAIGAYLQVRFGSEPDPDAMLFPSRKGGGAITPGQAWWVLRAAAAGLANPARVGPHSLRKTNAADIFQKSEHNLVLTQRALGHASINTTISYLAPSQDAISQAILGLGEGPAPQLSAIA